MFTRKDLIKLIIPLIIEQVLAVTVGMADSMMVARVGETAVSGVSLVDSLNVLLIGLFSALATGGAVVSSQYLGHKDEDNACVAGEQLIAITFMISLVLMVLTFALGKYALILLFGDVETAVMANARIYLFYSAMSYPFIAVYNACAALFRSMGNSKISMITSAIMNLINIIGNAILIFGFDMGVAGAAIATLISRIFAAMIMLILLKNTNLPIHIQALRSLRINFSMIKRILRIGVPNGMENSVFQIGKILVQGITASLGTSAITATAIAGNVGGLGVLPGSAMSLALITVVGRCVGARDYDGVKLYTKKLIKIAYIVMGILNIMIIIMIPLILKLYSLTEETGSIASELITYHCILSSLIWPLSFSLPNALRAANDVKYTMWVSMISMWIWRIAFSYILAITLEIGVLGVWIAMTIDWLFRSICFVVRFRKEKYRSMGML
ncbi:MATE family efflux transporter [Lachnospiraceae bacterium MD1]|jgi:putative MATE family efflux protein|uniref:Probable multidrug resistance protein NorM n=1 Tax=Variimorphobacter saccharofermentans TaxID=2755051 RepID=A0A839K110_9FIRM|nr:MATE family efflux transporter [Variimorphobacter saccharofermentans]MBB2182411.1 MATE family efflux transporter [Variimorphobacter saccharofermentans]